MFVATPQPPTLKSEIFSSGEVVVEGDACFYISFLQILPQTPSYPNVSSQIKKQASKQQERQQKHYVRIYFIATHKLSGFIS